MLSAPRYVIRERTGGPDDRARLGAYYVFDSFSQTECDREAYRTKAEALRRVTTMNAAYARSLG